MTTLTALSQKAVTQSRLARHLAEQVDEIRYTVPVGMSSRPDATGIPRPVEATVVACDTRGVSDYTRSARHALATASQEIVRATHFLEVARTAWTNENTAEPEHISESNENHYSS